MACLQEEYGLPVVQVDFLPLGADRNTAVYRVVAADGRTYFLKLRKGVFDETSVALPKFLADQGIEQVIPAITTRKGNLWASLESFRLILSPFIEGHNGYQVNLSDHHWVTLGMTLKRIHTTVVPPALKGCIRRETYTPQWRESVKDFMGRLDDSTPEDPIAAELAGFLRAKHEEILDLVGRAERLAAELQARSENFVLCHSDIHAGNLLISAEGALYLVDWDEPIWAMKERDLMSVGGGLMGGGHTPQEEETLFYQGYGPTPIDPVPLAYYRYERIIDDIAVDCDCITSGKEGDDDRRQSLGYLKSNFLPHNTIEIAYQSDRTHKNW
ncbi:MAG: aminoglycoside phosphotransferase family protein [Coprothermobacterota bacterium]|nr:aminoglycoside phosphotransferase family protein [Coprothermobacterota bacterium]